MPAAKTLEAEVEYRRKVSCTQPGVSKGPGKSWSIDLATEYLNRWRGRPK